jgi:tRNA 5-methylaminomethyl-2-thiouridine biosynthesis bifunctional protein
VLSALVARVDAFELDAHPLPSGPSRLPKALARLAARSALLRARSTNTVWEHGLRAAGFVCETEASTGTLARYAPVFVPKRSPSAPHGSHTDGKHALVLGAGLAGCASAWALSEHGWTTTLIDRQDAPARETSGNAAGLFHGIVNPQDGVHARFNRAAALETQRAVDIALHKHHTIGQRDGLLRLASGDANVAEMNAMLQRLQLPSSYVRAVPPDEATELAGLPVAVPAWFYPGGGWVSPAGLAASYLARASNAAVQHMACDVHSIRRVDRQWQVLDVQGTVIEEAEVLVLANALHALSLVDERSWSQLSVRGQISMMPAEGMRLPLRPLAGAGYVLPRVDGQAVFGATSQPGDSDAAVRDADHQHNLAQLARLTGQAIDADGRMVTGRTGWRCVTDDRLPLIGAVPDLAAVAASESIPDRPRRVPRLPGLFVFSGLGSRGITWSALGAQTLAASISGAPMPMEASLLDAVDPARFVSRTVRRKA